MQDALCSRIQGGRASAAAASTKTPTQQIGWARPRLPTAKKRLDFSPTTHSLSPMGKQNLQANRFHTSPHRVWATKRNATKHVSKVPIPLFPCCNAGEKTATTNADRSRSTEVLLYLDELKSSNTEKIAWRLNYARHRHLSSSEQPTGMHTQQQWGAHRVSRPSLITLQKTTAAVSHFLQSHLFPRAKR